MILTREMILAAEDRPVKEVKVPEWGGVVRIRGWSGQIRDDYERVLAESKTFHNIRARVVSLSIVDEKNDLVFNEGDVKALGQKSGAALQRVFDEVLKLNKLLQTDLEEEVKN